MVSAKRIKDLTDYTGILPYASERFGIYQPILGWKSKRIEERFSSGFENDKTSILENLKKEFTGLVDIKYNADHFPEEINIEPGALKTGKIRSFGSILLHLVSLRLPAYEEYNPSIWSDIITFDFINHLLKTDVVKAYRDAWRPTMSLGIFERTLRENESAIGAALLHLVEEKQFDALRDIFYSTKDNSQQALELIKMYSAKNST